MLPLFEVMAALVNVICPALLLSASAFNTTFNLLLVDVIFAFTNILLSASRVNVASAPVVFDIALLTVISPACEFVPDDVVFIKTLVPAFNAVSILPVVTMALSLVVVKFGVLFTFVSLPDV